MNYVSTWYMGDDHQCIFPCLLQCECKCHGVSPTQSSYIRPEGCRAEVSGCSHGSIYREEAQPLHPWRRRIKRLTISRAQCEGQRLEKSMFIASAAYHTHCGCNIRLIDVCLLKLHFVVVSTTGENWWNHVWSSIKRIFGDGPFLKINRFSMYPGGMQLMNSEYCSNTIRKIWENFKS